MNKHNLARFIDRLENKLLVKRYTSAEHGLGNRIIINTAGIRLLLQVWPVYSAAIQTIFAEKLYASQLQ